MKVASAFVFIILLVNSATATGFKSLGSTNARTDKKTRIPLTEMPARKTSPIKVEMSKDTDVVQAAIAAVKVESKSDFKKGLEIAAYLGLWYYFSGEPHIKVYLNVSKIIRV